MPCSKRSRADYGMEADIHLRELRQIRDTGRVPVRFDWCPKEVLDLTRWSEPGEPSGVGDDAVLREHLKRAFCCAALLRGPCEPGNADVEFGCESDTLAQALASGQSWNAITGISPTVLAATAVNVIAILGWLWIVRDPWVRDAGDQFARALLANCDALATSQVKTKPKNRSRDVVLKG